MEQYEDQRETNSLQSGICLKMSTPKRILSQEFLLRHCISQFLQNLLNPTSLGHVDFGFIGMEVAIGFGGFRTEPRVRYQG